MQYSKTTNETMLFLGRQGEHLARAIQFTELDEWRQIYGEGEVRLVNLRPGEQTPYPVTPETEDGSIIWKLTATDTALNGYGQCELQYLVGEVIVKSKLYVTLVAKAVNGSGSEVPATAPSWIDQVLTARQTTAEQAAIAAAAAEQAAAAAVHQPIVQDGTWWTWDMDTGAYADTGAQAEGPVGADGHTPVKGTDYWTADDQQAIVEAVLAALPAAEEASF